MACVRLETRPFSCGLVLLLAAGVVVVVKCESDLATFNEPE